MVALYKIKNSGSKIYFKLSAFLLGTYFLSTYHSPLIKYDFVKYEHSEPFIYEIAGGRISPEGSCAERRAKGKQRARQGDPWHQRRGPLRTMRYRVMACVDSTKCLTICMNT